MEFINGGIAGAGATIFSNPMDMVKVRLQLQGELKSWSETTAKYRGTFHAMYVIAKNEGLLALQKGLAPAMVLGFIMNSVRLGIFRLVELEGWLLNKTGEISVPKTIFWGGTSGYFSAALCNPLSILKVRLQAEADKSIAVGRQYHYKGMCDGFIKILKADGFRGLYTGANAAGTRLAVGSAAQLSTFSKAKELLLSYGLFKSSPIQLAFGASAVSGIVISLAACPVDVATVRLFNQGTGKGGKILYNGLLDCLIKILRTEGFYGWYKGVGPLYLRLAPHTTISLVIWDTLKHFQQKYNPETKT